MKILSEREDTLIKSSRYILKDNKRLRRENGLLIALVITIALLLVTTK